jgi:hypothetical protein
MASDDSIPNMTEADKRRIERYMLLDANDLVALIPSYLPEYRETLFAPEGQRNAGWREFDRLKSVVVPILCVDWNLCKKIKSEQYKDAISLISAIADIIAAHSGFVPPFLASTIIFKMGVRQLCKCPE